LAVSKIKVLADVSISKIVLSNYFCNKSVSRVLVLSGLQLFRSKSHPSLLLVGEYANVVIDEACREADFKGMERETRRLADPRSHETLMTLNRADLCSVKPVD